MLLLDHIIASAVGGCRVWFPDAGEAAPIPLGELIEEAVALAPWIEAEASGGAVGIPMTNDRGCLRAVLGAWLAGVPVASLPVPGRGGSAERYLEGLRAAIATSAVSIVIADTPVARLLGAHGVDATAFDEVPVRPGEPLRAVPVTFVQHTSGTTAAPRGLRFDDGALLGNVEAVLRRLEVGPEAGSCSWLPLSHDMGFVGMTLASLVGAHRRADGVVTIADPRRFVTDPAHWLRLCEATGSTITAAPNFALDLVVRTDRRRRIEGDLSSLRSCIVGGELISASTLEAFDAILRRCGAPSAAIAPAYGLAELGVAASLSGPAERWRTIRVAGTAGLDEAVGCGRPLDGYDARVEDGELWLRGPSIARSAADDTTLASPSGWLRTHDRAVLVDGEVVALGRLDDAIVVRGRTIHAAHIEAAVVGPGLRPGSALAFEVGGGIGVIVEPADATASPADPTHLVEQAHRRIRRELGIAPRVLALVPRGTVPKTSSGKGQRHRARALVQAGDHCPLAQLGEPETEEPPWS